MHSADLIRELKAHGCYLKRMGKGDHQVWYSPITNRTFAVNHPVKDMKIGTLKSIRKQAGLK